jgi:hypothetical protein
VTGRKTKNELNLGLRFGKGNRKIIIKKLNYE